MFLRFADALNALLARASAATAGAGDPGPHISAPGIDQAEGVLPLFLCLSASLLACVSVFLSVLPLPSLGR